MYLQVIAVGSIALFCGVASAAPAPARTPAPVPARVGASDAAPAEGLPTVEQLNQQLNEGRHQEVLRHVAKLLALRGAHAESYDRYDLLCLRGEAALRGKANPMAAEAFAQAAKATEDPQKQSVARATEVLIRRSKPLGYVPRAPQAAPAAPAGGRIEAPAKGAKANQPLPIIEPADRKAALAALLADEMAVAKPKVDAATRSSGLPPIIDAIKAVADLRAIEMAANGTSEQTKAMVGGLGDHAHRLISQAIEPMKARTEECWRQGSRTRYVEDRRTTLREKLYGMVGLTSTEANDLKAIIVTCEKIQPVASELAAVTERAELIADAQDAKQLHARAMEVLNFDYPNEGRYNKPPRR